VCAVGHSRGGSRDDLWTGEFAGTGVVPGETLLGQFPKSL
jgi:hypothetical protein